MIGVRGRVPELPVVFYIPFAHDGHVSLGSDYILKRRNLLFWDLKCANTILMLSTYSENAN